MFAPSLSRMARLLLLQLGHFPLHASVLPRVLSDTEASVRTVAVHTSVEDICRARLWGSCWLRL